MATEPLLSFTLIGMQEEKREVLDFLHDRGIIHVKEREESLSADSPPEELEQVSSALLELRWMIEHLKPYSPAVTSNFSGADLDSLLKAERELAVHHKDIETLTKKHSTIQDKLGTLRSRLSLLRKIPFRLDSELYTNTGDFVFTMLAKGQVNDYLGDLRDKLTVVCRGEYAFIAGRIEDYNDVYQALRSCEIIKIPELKGTHRKVMSSLKSEIRDLSKEKKKIEKKLRSLAGIYRKAVAVHADLSIYHERYTIGMGKTEQTFVLEGYVPHRKLKALKDVMQAAKVHLDVDDVPDGPSKLHNAFYVQHFEFITKMFGLPKYGRLDPTIYLSIFIPLFFGFMFSDMGYALLLAVLSGWLLSKADKTRKIYLDSGMVLLTCSLTTALFGWFFGSFFGNLLNLKPLLFDPFQNAKMILVLSLAIGLLHINLGLLLGIYANLHNWKVLLYDYISLLALQAGALLLAFGLDAGFAVLLFAVVLLVIRQSFMGLMEITKFLGAWFSYARLLALCLATAGIALGVNIMAEKLSSLGLFGPVLFVLMLLVGHSFNFVMNVLGSSIHSVRLHYIEFFSRFYEGDGEPFVAYSSLKTKDTL